jgi:hypothetical protein
MQTDCIIQIVHSLHSRLTKLEKHQKFLGPNFTESEDIEKAISLLQKVISFFDWDAQNKSKRFSTHEIIFNRLLPGNKDLVYFKSKPNLIEMIPSVFKSYEFGFGRGCKAGSAVIVLQIVLNKKLLTDAEIATCIVQTVNEQYSNGSEVCKKVIKRYLSMIKNSLNDEICSRCITPWPPRLGPTEHEFLNNLFKGYGFNPTVTFNANEDHDSDSLSRSSDSLSQPNDLWDTASI